MESDPKRSDLYTTYRDYLKHEDGLINFRLTWNLTTQGFLFTAFGFSLHKLVDLADKALTARCAVGPVTAKQLADGLASVPYYNALEAFACWGVPVAGMVVSVAAVLGIWAAQDAIRKLQRLWHLSDEVYAREDELKRAQEDLKAAGAAATTGAAAALVANAKDKAKDAQDALRNALKTRPSIREQWQNESPPENPMLPLLPPLAGGGGNASAILGRSISLLTPVAIFFVWLAIMFVVPSCSEHSVECPPKPPQQSSVAPQSPEPAAPQPAPPPTQGPSVEPVDVGNGDALPPSIEPATEGHGS